MPKTYRFVHICQIYLLQNYVVCFAIIRLPGNEDYREQNFNRLRGEDHWIGRSVEKNFGGCGLFRGTVHDVDDHEGFEGHRLFQVVYDDGDDEWLEVDELASILLPPESNVAMVQPA